jgi:polyhydroxyalkanoate synthesis regulator phasin
MNSDNLVQLVQKSFRVTLGATTSFIEVIQNPEKRQANFSEIRSKLNERMEDWENKGEVTEQEARKFVDTMWQQRQNSNAGTTENSGRHGESSNNSFTVGFPNFVDSLSQFWRHQTKSSTTVEDAESSTSTTVDPQVQTELQNLTAQIAAMRAELETLRKSEQ